MTAGRPVAAPVGPDGLEAGLDPDAPGAGASPAAAGAVGPAVPLLLLGLEPQARQLVRLGATDEPVAPLQAAARAGVARGQPRRGYVLAALLARLVVALLHLRNHEIISS